MFKKIAIICVFVTFFGSYGYAAKEESIKIDDDTPIYHGLFKYDNSLRPSDTFLRYLGIDPQAMPDTIFHTDKVYLRLFENSDRAALMNLYDDKRYMEYFPDARHSNTILNKIFDEVSWIRDKIENDGVSFDSRAGLMFVICQLTDDAVVGVMEVMFIDEDEFNGKYMYSASLDYAINKKYSGIGYATDAVKIIIDILQRSSYLACVCAQVDPDNKASSSVLCNNGFKYHRTQKKHLFRKFTGLREYYLSFGKDYDDSCKHKMCKMKIS